LTACDRRAYRPRVAGAGDVLEDARTGERLVFLRVVDDMLEYELWFTPRGFSTQPHLHPSQDEQHEVVGGRLGVVSNGVHRVLEPGDAIDVRAGTPHRIFAIGEQQVHAIFRSRPALRSAELLERLFALGERPGLVELARIGRDFRAEGHTTRPPLAVQKALLHPLARLGDDGAEYVFVDEWDADAPIEAVFDTLADGRTYPEWWTPVYVDVEADGPAHVGGVSRQHFKGRLPYHLRTTSTIVALDRPHRLEADVEGDLRGKGVWTLTPLASGGTHVRFDWRVYADRPLLRVLTPVLRPAFRWNHAWAIARARTGLGPYARRRALVR
jgi:uncharacterized protein YndB with AHSA1/START domain/mannose-6-phosphate isomerase-like protein (cupin superfamily)